MPQADDVARQLGRRGDLASVHFVGALQEKPPCPMPTERGLVRDDLPMTRRRDAVSFIDERRDPELAFDDVAPEVCWARRIGRI